MEDPSRVESEYLRSGLEKAGGKFQNTAIVGNQLPVREQAAMTLRENPYEQPTFFLAELKRSIALVSKVGFLKTFLEQEANVEEWMTYCAGIEYVMQVGRQQQMERISEKNRRDVILSQAAEWIMRTLLKQMAASNGSYILKGIPGEIVPLPPDDEEVTRLECSTPYNWILKERGICNNITEFDAIVAPGADPRTMYFFDACTSQNAFFGVKQEGHSIKTKNWNAAMEKSGIRGHKFYAVFGRDLKWKKEPDNPKNCSSLLVPFFQQALDIAESTRAVGHRTDPSRKFPQFMSKLKTR